jgi:hypothetical protein
MYAVKKSVLMLAVGLMVGLVGVPSYASQCNEGMNKFIAIGKQAQQCVSVLESVQGQDIITVRQVYNENPACVQANKERDTFDKYATQITAGNLRACYKQNPRPVNDALGSFGRLAHIEDWIQRYETESNVEEIMAEQQREQEERTARLEQEQAERNAKRVEQRRARRAEKCERFASQGISC